MIKRFLLMLIKAYRLFLSPHLGNACRFEPSCSIYAHDAIELHGALSGVYLTFGRLARCHPWCQGGIDPVPQEKPRPFSKLIVPSSFKK